LGNALAAMIIFDGGALDRFEQAHIKPPLVETMQ
jgi:hypothetical protein